MIQAVDWRAYETPRLSTPQESRPEPPLIMRDRLYPPLREAARRLGWSGPASESDDHVARLRGGGLLAVQAILDEAAACSREEVLNDAADVIAQFEVNDALLTELGRVILSAPTPVKRAVAVRALGYLPGAPDRRLQYLERALGDVDPEVRDRAAIALGGLGDARAMSVLESALAAERVAMVRESIADALESLRA